MILQIATAADVGLTMTQIRLFDTLYLDTNHAVLRKRRFCE